MEQSFIYLDINLLFLNMHCICKCQRECHLTHCLVTFSNTKSSMENMFKLNSTVKRVCFEDSFNIKILFNFPSPFFLPFHNVKSSVCGCNHLAPLFGSHYLITAAGEARNQLLEFPLLPMSD